MELYDTVLIKMKKRIGISFSEANFQNYWNWFSEKELGADLELVELSFLKNNIDELDNCTGLVLTGGVDVIPAISGGASQYPNMPDEFLPKRDEFERLIYAYAKDKRRPLLGICRGMQYINILEGGKVLDDLGLANEQHRRTSIDKIHGLDVLKSTLLHEITGLDTGYVNSAHHQAIDPRQLSSSLLISAYSNTEDATIEAIEFKDKSNKAFMMGIQWHPERMQGKESSPLSQGIKERFLKEVRNT